jgi:hypothetical protein
LNVGISNQVDKLTTICDKLKRVSSHIYLIVIK